MIYNKQRKWHSNTLNIQRYNNTFLQRVSKQLVSSSGY